MWNPIETLPKNGNFLLYLPDEKDDERIQPATVRPNCLIIGDRFSYDWSKPSHWMERPKAPEELK